MKTIRPPTAIIQVEISPQAMKVMPMAMKNGQKVGSGRWAGLAGKVVPGGGRASCVADGGRASGVAGCGKASCLSGGGRASGVSGGGRAGSSGGMAAFISGVIVELFYMEIEVTASFFDNQWIRRAIDAVRYNKQQGTHMISPPLC